MTDGQPERRHEFACPNYPTLAWIEAGERGRPIVRLEDMDDLDDRTAADCIADFALDLAAKLGEAEAALAKWERATCARCGKDMPIKVPVGNPNMEVCGPCEYAMIAQGWQKEKAALEAAIENRPDGWTAPKHRKESGG